jgi:DNA-binding FrmR family transcriptional regulator|tara:strand:- start:121 stop:267 length:147 start_codon:yes stop_codon:yes gene_type:complete
MDGREIGDRVDITILKEIREILQRMEGQLKGIEKNLKKEKPKKQLLND